jgi:hypothetical protein
MQKSVSSFIKPSLQHFQFCRVGFSLGILFFSILTHEKKMPLIYVNDTLRFIITNCKNILHTANTYKNEIYFAKVFLL